MISRLFESRASDPITPRRIFAELGDDAGGGMPVSSARALQLAPVFGCVRVLSHALASLPLHLFRRTADGGREKAIQHPVYPLLAARPNPLQQTRFALVQAGMHQALLGGSCFLRFPRGANGHVTAVELLDPTEWHAVIDSRRRKALARYDREAVLVEGEFAHIFGFSADGILGLSPITAARRAFTMGLSLADFGESFMARGARLSGVLTHPGELGSEGIKNVQSGFREQFGGSSNAGGVPVLEEGMTFQAMSVSPDDAQFLESRQFAAKEIAGIFGVPPHRIGEMSEATFTNIESQNQDFYTSSVVHWCTAWEGALNAALFPNGTYYVKFETANLVRGDIAARNAAYTAGRNGGWLSANDVLRLEDMNPRTDPGGDDYLMPLNMAPSGDVADDDGEQEDRLAILRPSIRRVAERTVTFEGRRLRDVVKRARKSDGPADRLAEEIGRLYRELPAYLEAELTPLFAGVGGQNGAPALAEHRARRCKGRAVEGLSGGAGASWEGRIEQWIETEPAEWAEEIEGALR